MPAGGSFDDPRDRAKREAWGFAVLVASVLEREDNNAFPGIRALLADFRRVEAAMPALAAGTEFPTLDSETLVTRNPRFWSACYEIAPGEPGFALLHAALLLCGGEAQRATVIATLGLQRGATPPGFKRGLEAIIAGAQAAQAGSQALVRQGVILHDAQLYDAALRKFEEALALWPANGPAHYERGSTLRMKAITDAARTRQVSNSASDEEPVSDPPATYESFARARRHDPFCVMAYQGNDPAARAGLMALVRTALPVWETIRKRPEAPATREELRDLAEACRDAGIAEYALVARQLLVARTRHYQGDDLEFITACVRQLAPDADVPATLARFGGDTRLTRQIAAPEPSGEIAHAAVGGEALLAGQIAADEARRAKAAASEKKAAARSKAKKRKRK